MIEVKSKGGSECGSEDAVGNLRAEQRYDTLAVKKRALGRSVVHPPRWLF